MRSAVARTRTRPLLVLAVCCLSLFIVSMDVTIVNVALPSIRAEFGASVTQLQWIVDAYVVVLASFLLLAGATADRLGRRRVFQTGLLLFGVASLVCSLAPDAGTLIAARAAQGLGGSMLNPVAMSIITNTFTVPRERARAVGVWGAVIGVAMAVGPVAGGWLTETIGWRSVFWVNVPVALAAIVLCALFVPESRAAVARRVDILGQICVVLALASLVFALIEAPLLGWGSRLIVALLALSAAAVLTLILHARRTPEPVIEPRFFRSVPFSAATVIAVLGFAGYGAFLFINALYLQEVRELSPVQAGLRMLPLAASTFVSSLLSGRLVGRFGARPSFLLAGGLIAASAVLLLGVDAHTPDGTLALAYVLFGFGFGTINAPITTTAVAGMPLAQSGVASAVASTSRQVGTALGVALAGTLTAAGAGALLGDGFTAATHTLWFVVAGCGVAIALLGYVSTTPAALRTAQRVAEARGR